ncbi:MAG: type II toxin-antitoxin system HicB family antitoxin [Thermodesulfovibrio sp.]|nr:type II toxin-antitoxin system HicB family antitoxin [Thermodesulfovibrio sp.]
MKLTVVIEKDEHGYFVYCPVLKGCMSQGETYEEALANIKEAIELYLGTLLEEIISNFPVLVFSLIF